MKYLLPLLALVACSSKPEKAIKDHANVSNEAFRKEKPLSNSEVSEYYETTGQSSSPALQDETLDRYTSEELAKINTSTDPLMDISVRCSRKDYEGAFSVASKAFNRYQKVAAYWNQVANCHLNQGSYRKALLFYNKALEVRPNYVPALNNIGVMYSRQGQFQKAMVAFERANRQSKFSKTPRFNLAQLYQTYGLTESSLPIFQSLLNEAPLDVGLLNAVASSYFLISDYGKALSYYQKIPQAQWSKPEIGLNIAITLKKSGKAKDAAKVFAMVDKPKKSNLKRYYAVIEKQLGDAE